MACNTLVGISIIYLLIYVLDQYMGMIMICNLGIKDIHLSMHVEAQTKESHSSFQGCVIFYLSAISLICRNTEALYQRSYNSCKSANFLWISEVYVC